MRRPPYLPSQENGLESAIYLRLREIHTIKLSWRLRIALISTIPLHSRN
jgi:hypothetical protein